MVVGVLDGGFNLLHPAWNDETGASRVLEVAVRPVGSALTWQSPAEVNATNRGGAYPEAGNHGQTVAAVIGADAQNGQDPSLARTKAGRRLRTGFAPKVLYRLASKNWSSSQYEDNFAAELLSLLIDGNHPIDVLNNSWSAGRENSDCTDDYTLDCGNEESIRGLSVEADLFNQLFYDLDIVNVKSAGNAAGTCCYAEYDISGPCARALISVGALNGLVDVPADLEDISTLDTASEGGILLDGRTWPNLVTTSSYCGAMAPVYQTSGGLTGYFEQSVVGTRPAYGLQSHTSSATPKIAGAAVLFKAWLLTYASLSRDRLAGHVIAGLLNMTDRYNDEGALRAQPYWGLGRFKMRTWTAGSAPDATLYRTRRQTIVEGETISIMLDKDLGEEAEVLERLDAIVWWDERNTDEGQVKPFINVMVMKALGSGSYEVVDIAHNYNGTGLEQHVSLTFSAYDASKPSLEAGYPYHLRIVAATMPESDVYGASRELYISVAVKSRASKTYGPAVDAGRLLHIGL